ncbi:MAG TPA: hypothetical protein DEE98_02145 [Elusimicrobia bacterium]|nr:MAG: hypothetical protein A2278_08265 [Elusimicrobia bacterium RIFOXYA12_FULL_49_49]OGS09835.1 MAG: hypothetical protein A2204_07255 [Elusimicrobia bacterium RIFOXYA1_FULL_47_7]OGS11069.1 MAG: hypothetical protein A2386_04410 [Elusimicrobia bacterium RIFOXYB1_FULL_48_9]OGS15941.1 MAG: hypothetical protein A2251_02000 [Elusimicrobia bacterium RIFOXYA2_FULL_47_53]OGS26377.1 MAG: hypothetical protein A2339_03270 [Elusimicrobia bacterium RIFOXYB12_FULL_50_12]OGS29109.1 MAG: hypothetical protein
MKICFVLPSFHPIVGGTEKQALSLAKSLKNTGVSVIVATRQSPGLRKEEIIEGIPVYRLFSPGKGRFASLFFSLSLFLFLISRRADYDIIHCHLISTLAAVSAFAAKLLNKRLIVKLGGRGSIGDVNHITKQALAGNFKLNLIKRKASFFVCPTADIAGELAEAGVEREKIRTIYNGVDTGVYRPAGGSSQIEALKNKLFKGSGKFICFTGRLSPEKNPALLMEAFIPLAAKFKEYNLAFVGAGPLENTLRKTAKENNLDERILFTGSTDNVAEYLQACEIFAITSLSEGLPNAMLEAMACGLPVVASNVGGCAEFISDMVNGVLFESKNASQLSAKLEMLIKDPALADRISENARGYVAKTCGLSSVTGEYIKLYASAAAARL